MFGSGQAKPNGNAAVDTLVGRQTEILGDVHFAGGLHVDGCIKGSVVSDEEENSNLSISSSGVIEGSVTVANVALGGTVMGDVRATGRLRLASTARIVGDVHYRTLEMAAGASINGKLLHENASATPAALTHDGSRDEDETATVMSQKNGES